MGYCVEKRKTCRRLWKILNCRRNNRLPPAQQARYRFMSWTRVWHHLVNRDFPVVVIGNTTFASAASWPWEGVERVLVESGYVHVRTMGDAKIYVVRNVNPS